MTNESLIEYPKIFKSGEFFDMSLADPNGYDAWMQRIDDRFKENMGREYGFISLNLFGSLKEIALEWGEAGLAKILLEKEPERGANHSKAGWGFVNIKDPFEVIELTTMISHYLNRLQSLAKEPDQPWNKNS